MHHGMRFPLIQTALNLETCIVAIGIAVRQEVAKYILMIANYQV
jgi:hypothetical protein